MKSRLCWSAVCRRSRNHSKLHCTALLTLLSLTHVLVSRRCRVTSIRDEHSTDVTFTSGLANSQSQVVAKSYLDETFTFSETILLFLETFCDYLICFQHVWCTLQVLWNAQFCETYFTSRTLWMWQPGMQCWIGSHSSITARSGGKKVKQRRPVLLHFSDGCVPQGGRTSNRLCSDFVSHDKFIFRAGGIMPTGNRNLSWRHGSRDRRKSARARFTM